MISFDLELLRGIGNEDELFDSILLIGYEIGKKSRRSMWIIGDKVVLIVNLYCE